MNPSIAAHTCMLPAAPRRLRGGHPQNGCDSVTRSALARCSCAECQTPGTAAQSATSGARMRAHWQQQECLGVQAIRQSVMAGDAQSFTGEVRVVLAAPSTNHQITVSKPGTTINGEEWGGEEEQHRTEPD
jgi:hypothetical protein